jgi:hypothetical protein
LKDAQGLVQQFVLRVFIPLTIRKRNGRPKIVPPANVAPDTGGVTHNPGQAEGTVLRIDVWARNCYEMEPLGRYRAEVVRDRNASATIGEDGVRCPLDTLHRRLKLAHRLSHRGLYQRCQATLSGLSKAKREALSEMTMISSPNGTIRSVNSFPGA